MKFAITLLLLGITGYLSLCALLYTQQEKLLFHPTRVAADEPYRFTHPFTEINLPVAGATINVVHFTTPEPKGVILYLHGNGDIVLRLEALAANFLALGYDVLIPDYRGYGKSSGAITNETDFVNDMQAVYAYAQQQYAEEQITLYGQSMGTGLATWLAAQNQPLRLILESPYYSLRDLVRTRMPWVPAFLLKYQLRTDLWLQQVRCPIFLLHGTIDQVIPYDASVRLFALIGQRGEFLTVDGAGHGSLLGREEVQRFIESILL